MRISPDLLRIDVPETIRTIAESIRAAVRGTLRRKGAVVGMSGGVDSSVCAALCVHALGEGNVLGLFMPDRESSPDSLRLSQMVASQLHIQTCREDITPILEATGCYRLQTDAIRQLFPDYGESWKSKVTLPSILEGERLNVSRLTVESPAGEQKSARLPLQTYLRLIAATNFKQRTRKMLEYYHADRLHYAVCGTPNRLEYDQGFFVKNGDGSADFKPIAHLYKTQVYALAGALNIPAEIVQRPPTTDTFSMAQTQEEFYFSLPYEAMDLCLYGRNHHLPAADVAAALALTREQVELVYRDIDAKRHATLPLHLSPLLVSRVEEIDRIVREATIHGGDA